MDNENTKIITLLQKLGESKQILENNQLIYSILLLLYKNRFISEKIDIIDDLINMKKETSKYNMLKDNTSKKIYISKRNAENPFDLICNIENYPSILENIPAFLCFGNDEDFKKNINIKVWFSYEIKEQLQKEALQETNIYNSRYKQYKNTSYGYLFPKSSTYPPQTPNPIPDPPQTFNSIQLVEKSVSVLDCQFQLKSFNILELRCYRPGIWESWIYKKIDPILDIINKNFSPYGENEINEYKIKDIMGDVLKT